VADTVYPVIPADPRNQYRNIESLMLEEQWNGD
jgi:hypothetical protein